MRCDDREAVDLASVFTSRASVAGASGPRVALCAGTQTTYIPIPTPMLMQFHLHSGSSMQDAAAGRVRLGASRSDRPTWNGWQ